MLTPTTNQSQQVEIPINQNINYFSELLHHAFTAPQPSQKHKLPLVGITVPDIILGAASILCTWMYIAPSLEVGKAMNSMFLEVMTVLGNTIPSALVVLNIGNHYLSELDAARDAINFISLLKKHGYISNKLHAEATKNLHGILTHGKQWGKNVCNTLIQNQLHVLILAALTALPYGTAAMYYPDWPSEPTWLLSIKTLVTFLIYTLVHTLPIKLILEVPALHKILIDLPAAPFTLSLRAIHYCTTSKHELAQEQKLLQIRNNQINLQKHFLRNLHGIIDDFRETALIKKNYGCETFKIDLPSGFTNLIAKIYNKTISEEESVNLFTMLLAHHNTRQHSNPPNTGWLSYISNFTRKTLGIIGGSVVGFSVTGYLKANYDLFHKITNSALGGLALLLPTAIVTEVLTVYFGQESLTAPYDLLRNFQVPYALKLAPVIGASFLAFAHTLNLFSWGTAVQLERDTFPADQYSDTFRNVLMADTIIGLILYGAANIGQLASKFASYVLKTKISGSSEEMKLYLAVIDALSRLELLITKIKPEDFQKIMNTISDANTEVTEQEEQDLSLLTSLGLEKNNETVTIKHENNRNQKPGFWSNCWASLFYRQEARSEASSEPQEEQELLLANE